MEIREVTNAVAWNSWLLAKKPNTFLQSWEWGQVQAASGERVKYLGLFDAGKQIGAALIITVNARRGRFLLVPHLLLPHPRSLALGAVVAYGRTLARKTGAVALRIAPLVETTAENVALFRSQGFRPAPLHVHTELTWMLDITPREEQLLAGMRKTTRQAIKKAQLAGVVVSIDDTGVAVERFLPLYRATEQRHGFVRFPDEQIRAQVTLLAVSKRVLIVIARHGGRDVAGAIMVQFGPTVFYHHGASLKLPSNVPAAQLLQWEAIREAKRRGATKYNFWGVASDNQPYHPFAGITVFKKGFGGYAIDYMHAQDLPLSLIYWKLWAVDMVRKWQRGF